MKPNLKFNNGRGAILCKGCSVILKEYLTPDEWEGKTDLFYCHKCQMKFALKWWKTLTREQQEKLWIEEYPGNVFSFKKDIPEYQIKELYLEHEKQRKGVK